MLYFLCTPLAIGSQPLEINCPTQENGGGEVIKGGKGAIERIREGGREGGREGRAKERGSEGGSISEEGRPGRELVIGRATGDVLRHINLCFCFCALYEDKSQASRKLLY